MKFKTLKYFFSYQGIIEEIKYIKCHPKSVVARESGIRVFILISSIQTWALTKNKVSNHHYFILTKHK